MNEDPNLILNARRPGGQDDADPAIAEALASADPARAAAMQRADCAVADALNSVPPPPGLREQILTGARVTRRPASSGNWFERRLFGWLRYGEALAAAAIALILATAFVFNGLEKKRDADIAWQYAAAERVAAAESGDLQHREPAYGGVRDWLIENSCPVPEALPTGLARLKLFGCAAQSWRGTQMSIVCFSLGGRREVHLVTIPASAIPDKLTAEPQWADVAGFTTAQWAAGGSAYMLIGKATRPELEALLTVKTAMLRKTGPIRG